MMNSNCNAVLRYGHNSKVRARYVRDNALLTRRFFAIDENESIAAGKEARIRKYVKLRR